MTKKLLLTCSAALLFLSLTAGVRADPVYIGLDSALGISSLTINNSSHFAVRGDIDVGDRALRDVGIDGYVAGHGSNLTVSGGASESFQKAYTAVFGTAAPSRDLSVASGLSMSGAAIPNNVTTQSAPGCTPPRPVPEPTTLLLLGGGLAAVAAKLRRRRTKKLEAQIC